MGRPIAVGRVREERSAGRTARDWHLILQLCSQLPNVWPKGSATMYYPAMTGWVNALAEERLEVRSPDAASGSTTGVTCLEPTATCGLSSGAGCWLRSFAQEDCFANQAFALETALSISAAGRSWRMAKASCWSRKVFRRTEALRTSEGSAISGSFSQPFHTPTQARSVDPSLREDRSQSSTPDMRPPSQKTLWPPRSRGQTLP